MNISERFWIEKRDVDFPIYNDEQTGAKEIMALLTGGLIATVWALLPINRDASYMRPVSAGILFLGTLIPYLIAKWGKPGSLFQKPRLYDIVLILLFPVLLFVVASGTGIGLVKLGILDPGTLQTNPVVSQEKNLMLVVCLIFQLFGEEMFRIDIFLGLLAYFYKNGRNRKLGIIVGLLLSSLFFGAAHLHAYGNLLYCLCVQGVSGILLTYLYIRTKNIAVPYFVHLIYDFLLIFVL